MTPLSLPLTALALLHSCCLLDKNDDDIQLAKCSYFLTAPTREQPFVPQPSLKSCKTSPNSTVAHGPCSTSWQQVQKPNFIWLCEGSWWSLGNRLYQRIYWYWNMDERSGERSVKWWCGKGEKRKKAKPWVLWRLRCFKHDTWLFKVGPVVSTISFSPLNNPGGILTFQTRIWRLLAASKETRSWAGNELVYQVPG